MTINRIKVNHISESSFTVQGHGVDTAFIELSSSQEDIGMNVGRNRRWRDGILHAHTIGPWSAFRLIIHRGPKVIAGHVTPATLAGSIRGANAIAPLTNAYMRFIYGLADHVVAVSESGRRELNELGLKSVSVVPNSIRIEKFTNTTISRAEARRRVGIGQDDMIVLCVGQIQPRKGVATFLNVARNIPSARFVWVGGFLFGGLSESKKALTKVINDGTHSAQFVGQLPREEVIDWYRSADVFLFPSEHETFGLAVLEAAASGLPLVLRDLPVFKELFGAADPYLAKTDEQFTASVVELLNSPEKRASSSEKSQRMSGSYEGKVIAELTREMYGSLS